MKLTEAQLYNMQPAPDRSNKVVEYFQKVQALHMRLDHGMKLADIAKRLGIKMKDVKTLVGE